MRKYLKLSLVTVAAASLFLAYDLYHDESDIRAAKSISVTYLNQNRTVEQGLASIVSKGGAVKWSVSHITNSANHHLVAVEAVVSGRGQVTLPHEAIFHFRVNRDTGSSSLDYYTFDGRRGDARDGLKQIAAGSFI